MPEVLRALSKGESSAEPTFRECRSHGHGAFNLKSVSPAQRGIILRENNRYSKMCGKFGLEYYAKFNIRLRPGGGDSCATGASGLFLRRVIVGRAVQ